NSQHALILAHSSKPTTPTTGPTTGRTLPDAALVHAARLHKTSATVVLPADAPRVHRAAIKAIDHRTKVIHYDQKEAWPDALAQEIAYRDRLTLIPAANHASVIAGQARLPWRCSKKHRTSQRFLSQLGAARSQQGPY
ncbi:hypothetical protein ACWGC3_42625, partial [Streptomyces chartreusis]